MAQNLCSGKTAMSFPSRGLNAIVPAYGHFLLGKREARFQYGDHLLRDPAIHDDFILHAWRASIKCALVCNQG
jgi:hypothetical protein